MQIDQSPVWEAPKQTHTYMVNKSATKYLGNLMEWLGLEQLSNHKRLYILYPIQK